MENEGWCRLVDSFTLLKVAVMKTPELDKIMAAQCSKSNNQALTRIQALNFDTLGPLTELLEMINKEEGEITTEPGGSMQWSLQLPFWAIHFPRCQCCAKVLKEYYKKLLTFPQGRKMVFLKATPELFRPKFLRDAIEHLGQLSALQKVKTSSSSTGSSSGFWKPPSYHFSHQQYYASTILCTKATTTALLPANQRRREHTKKGPKDPK